MCRASLVVPLFLLGACASGVVVVSVPTPGSVGVSVLVEPVVEVAARHIELRKMGTPAPVAVRIVETGERTRLVEPLEPLDYASHYTLWVDGDATVFRTAMNPRLATFWHQGKSVYAGRYEIDRSGFEIRYETLTAPGLDETWLTSDDTISSYLRRVFEGSLVVQETQVNTPGGDGIWHTPDDGAVARNEHTYTEAMFPEATRSYRPGVDGVFDTDDDEQDLLIAYAHDDQGWPVQEASMAPGPDARYGTDDDIPYSYVEHIRDEDGRAVASQAAYTPGIDGVWFTEDDFSSGAILDYDSFGRRVRVVGYDAGADGVLFNDDDVVTSTTENLFDADGRWTHNIVIDASDTIVQRHRLERNVAGSIVRIVSYDADPEVPVGYATWTFTEDGNRVDEHGYTDPGPDEIWFNADDTLRAETLYADFQG